MTEQIGRKDDAEKPRYDLVPPHALDAVVRVLTLGAARYAPDNWKIVEGRRWRYFSAAMRHLWRWISGHTRDDGPKGTNESHLACAICSIMFLLDEEERTGGIEK